MNRTMTLLLAAVIGLLLAGLLMALLVPADPGHQTPGTAALVTGLSVGAAIGVALFSMKRRS